MGPYIMDVIYLMVLDHLFHHEFNPGWDSRYTADIPILGMFGNFLYALVPVGDGRNFKSRLVKVFRSEEHTSELQSRQNLVCRLLLVMLLPRASTLFPYTTLFRSPYIMDVIYLMVLDHLFHHEFNPGWDSRYTADIPILGMFGNFLYALVPVGDGRNFKSRLVKVF